MGLPVVAIMGRANVGKSTLFNRLLGERRAIVEPEPRITRDRNYGLCDWRGRRFVVVDTGGLIPPEEDALTAQVERQTRAALEEADAVLLLTDAREGLTPADEAIAGWLRKHPRPHLLVVNKVDHLRHERAALEFHRLGMSPVFAVSAEHGRGVGDLLDALIAVLPPPPMEVEEGGVRVAVVGRSNVGKSSLVNRLLGLERVLVDERPGTTRDPVDSAIERQGKRYVFVDTAGIRRRRRARRGKVEAVSSLLALRSLGRAEVALLLLDASEGVTSQDAAIGGHIVEAGAGCVLLLNKWDLVPKEAPTLARHTEAVRSRLPHLAFAPILSISALTGLRTSRIFPLIDRVAEERTRRVPTAELNRQLEGWLRAQPPPSAGGKPVKVYYATQSAVGPPTFVFFANRPDRIGPAYERFLERRLRETFGFEGTPIRLHFRPRGKGEGGGGRP
ncbi:MAG: ribosome biogenesis GTPase Der [Nitrospinota bacterium]